MSQYSDPNDGALFVTLCTDYAHVRHFSRYTSLRYEDLQSQSPKSQMLGELFAAVGIHELDFTPLKRTVALVDHYLMTGFLPRAELDLVSSQLKEQIKPLIEVRDCYKEAGKSRGKPVSAPQIIFVPYYARRLLETCERIDQKHSGEGKIEFLRFIRMQWLHNPEQLVRTPS